MSGSDSDGYSAFDFSEFTAEDFADVDAKVEQHFAQTSSWSSNTASKAASRSRSPVPADEQPAGDSFEFDRGHVVNLSQVTEEEFLEIDRIASSALNMKTPASLVQAEPTPIAETGPSKLQAPRKKPPSRSLPKANTWRYSGKRTRSPNPSLMDLFRWKRSLSVSDLVAPAWCEVQYDYGLRQKRSRPVKDRPKTFTTSSGKKIEVEGQVAEKNDVRTKQGQAVHKELEREVRAEEVKVDVVTDEERWGLRLLNTMACFQIMELEGYTREIPVFGILNDQVVVGIVDEVQRIPCNKKRSSTSPEKKGSPKRARSSILPVVIEIEDTLPSSQDACPPIPISVTEKSKGKDCSYEVVEIDGTLSPSPRAQSPSIPDPIIGKSRGSPKHLRDQYILRVVDTKTRTVNWMPPEDDTYSSRLQVMIYHRLLSALLSLDQPYDFPAFWDKLEVDPDREFSPNFVVQAGLLGDGSVFPKTTLSGVVDAWQHMVSRANVIALDTTLELVYRLQPKGAVWKGKGRMQVPKHLSPAAQEERDLARAIAASLPESSNIPSTSVIMEGDKNAVSTFSMGMNDEGVDADLQRALYQSLKPQCEDSRASGSGVPETAAHGVTAGPPSPPDVEAVDTSIHTFQTIGTKVFSYDEEMLQNHLDFVMEFWHGERKPVGVPPSLARRCDTCEYRNGCEWREEKASKLVNPIPAEDV